MSEKKYVYCNVLPENYQQSYLYIADMDVKAGDIVVISIKHQSKETQKVGLVLDVNTYTEANAPYPVQYTKHIKRIFSEEDAKDKEGNWYQYVVDKEEREIEYVDFTGKTMEEANAIMTGWTQKPFKQIDSPMNRIVIIKTPDGFMGTYNLVDHMTMDAQSLIYFMTDVIELYCYAKFEGVPYPKDMASYVEQLQKDLAYEAGCKAKDRDAEFFQKIIEESEPIYNGITGPQKLQLERERCGDPKLRAAVNSSREVDSALDIFHLEAEPTERLMKFCEEQHISLTVLLLMGLHTYFHKMNGNDDVSINTAIARRATLKEKKSGGTRIHSFPFRTILPREKTFMDGIIETSVENWEVPTENNQSNFGTGYGWQRSGDYEVEVYMPYNGSENKWMRFVENGKIPGATAFVFSQSISFRILPSSSRFRTVNPISFMIFALTPNASPINAGPSSLVSQIKPWSLVKMMVQPSSRYCRNCAR